MNSFELDKTNNMHHGADKVRFEQAANLRMSETDAEKLLWEKLRDKKLNGIKFRRQHPIAIFILDFYCHKYKLAIEVDGNYHFTEQQRALDQERTDYFRNNNIRLIRFSNEEVINKTEEVLNSILQLIEKES